MKYDDTIPQTSTVAFVFDLIRKLRSFLASKPKRPSKRLFTICPPPFCGRQGKGTKLYPNNCKYLGKNFTFNFIGRTNWTVKPSNYACLSKII